MTPLERIELFNKFIKWLKWESLEQARLVLWLSQNNYTFTAIPNSTFTKSIKVVIMNKLLWVNAWLCDIIIILKRGSLLFLELKKKRTRKKNGEYKAISSDWISISTEQAKWIEELDNIDNVGACICYGYEEAIEKIKEFET
jgi:hypothetical protein